MFKHKGDNVEVEVPLTIPEAIRGAEVEVPTLHGRKTLRVPAGTRHGTVQRLRGEGPPQARREGPRRHPLPLRHRRSGEPQPGAVRGGREALAGHERQPAREAVRAGRRREGLVMRRRRTTTRVTVDHERGVFMISVAAELADMHPQTLRMYETRGLIEPQRSPKGTRLYSQADVDAPAPHPGDDERARAQPGGRRARARARGAARAGDAAASRRSSAAAARCGRRWRPRSSACASRSAPRSCPTAAARRTSSARATRRRRRRATASRSSATPRTRDGPPRRRRVARTGAQPAALEALLRSGGSRSVVAARGARLAAAPCPRPPGGRGGRAAGRAG